MYIGIDPGKNIGVAWVDAQGQLIRSTIINLEQLKTTTFEGATIVMGNGTGSSKLKAVLDQRTIPLILVDETGTSLEARKLYFRDHPATGWQRLLPLGLRSPPRAVDDYAAYAIVLRFLKQSSGR